jgi:hypothetical protein
LIPSETKKEKLPLLQLELDIQKETAFIVHPRKKGTPTIDIPLQSRGFPILCNTGQTARLSFQTAVHRSPQIVS